MKQLTDEEYTAELERIVIFLAGAYTAGYDSVRVHEDGNGNIDERYMNILMAYPIIQGTGNRIFVERIGNLRNVRLNREAPQATWEQVFERISKGRKEIKR